MATRYTSHVESVFPTERCCQIRGGLKNPQDPRCIIGPQIEKWAPFVRFRLPGQARHAHHDQGQPPGTMNVGSEYKSAGPEVSPIYSNSKEADVEKSRIKFSLQLLREMTHFYTQWQGRNFL